MPNANLVDVNSSHVTLNRGHGISTKNQNSISNKELRMPKPMDSSQHNVLRQLDYISKPSQSNKNLTPYRQKGTIEYMYGYHQVHRRPKYYANNMVQRDRPDLQQPLMS